MGKKEHKNIGSADRTNRSAKAHATGKSAKRTDHWDPRLPERDGFRFSGMIIAFFTAGVILLVRMHSYQRPMDQFFWSNGKNNLVDFFSYYKMVFILICAVLAILVVLYRLTTQTFRLRRSYAYGPMLAYTVLVALSYIFSDYKEFSLTGYNDRFEGTLPLISYMVLLFFIINTIDAERHVKWVVWPVAGSSALLSILGLSQALDNDFFRTTLGKKLITPPYYWDSLDNLNFTFQNREIYQTVYNINYVSFYLALLVPLFTMLFIHQKGARSKALIGALLGLLLFNVVGSQSSGGLAGLGVAFIVAVVLLNKRLLRWRKDLLLVLAILVPITIFTADLWLPEIKDTFRGDAGSYRQADEEPVEPGGPASIRPTIDYLVTTGDSIELSLNGEPLSIKVSYLPGDQAGSIALSDGDGQPVPLLSDEETGVLSIDDPRYFTYMSISYGMSDEQILLNLKVVGEQFTFIAAEDRVVYATPLGLLISLEQVPAFGWEDHLTFGSGRGYIWSRSLPMVRDTILIGRGADTFNMYFPHDDVAGKYNAHYRLNKIVDKPHNMYLGMAIGTGALSLLALLLLYGVYLVQSFRLYFRLDFDDAGFLAYAGAGIFFGILGFLVAGLFNDSSVSVMPMFYGLLGTGIAINRMLGRRAAGGSGAAA